MLKFKPGDLIRYINKDIDDMTYNKVYMCINVHDYRNCKKESCLNCLFLNVFSNRCIEKVYIQIIKDNVMFYYVPEEYFEKV